MHAMKTNSIFKLLAAVAICELIGIGGAFFTAPAVSSDWYANLIKPSLQPPAWLFSPVWTALYALMGISAFLIWRKALSATNAKIGLGIFAVQLALNFLWSVVFFGLHDPGAAFADIALLWLAILATIASFAKISKPAAWLLVPYILWVSFAGYLNYSIWILNS